MAGSNVYRRPTPRRRLRKIAVSSVTHPIFYDAGIPSETTGAIRLDATVGSEWNISLRLDASVASEHLIVSRSDRLSPLEWQGNTTVFWDAASPLEWNAVARSDKIAPIEWGGSVTAISYDASVGLEWSGVIREDVPARLEWTPTPIPIFYDVGVSFEILSRTQEDMAIPAEWSGTPLTIQSVPGAPGRLPTYSDGDFLAGIQNLLPTGPVWPRDGDAQLTQTMAALVKTYTRQAARSVNLLDDAFPVSPLELLPEWELSLGLPDPCAGVLATVQQRQQQVAARFIAGGGQSVAFFINYAATLGFPITIAEFSPFRVGINRVGDPLRGAAWAHAWQVNAPTFSVGHFRVGEDAVGEPLAWWGNNVLQCELLRLAPAQTALLFSYS